MNNEKKLRIMNNEKKLKFVKDYIFSLKTRLQFMHEIIDLCEDTKAIMVDTQAEMLLDQVLPMNTEISNMVTLLEDLVMQEEVGSCESKS